MVRDVHVISDRFDEQECEFEVGQAFRVQSLSPSATQTRSSIITATSVYLSKLYNAGHVSDSDVVNFFKKMSSNHEK